MSNHWETLKQPYLMSEGRWVKITSQTSLTILYFVQERRNKQKKIIKRFVYDGDGDRKTCNLRPRSLKTILNAAENEHTEAKAKMFLLNPLNGLTQIK